MTPVLLPIVMLAIFAWTIHISTKSDPCDESEPKDTSNDLTEDGRTRYRIVGVGRHRFALQFMHDGQWRYVPNEYGGRLFGCTAPTQCPKRYSWQRCMNEIADCRNNLQRFASRHPRIETYLESWIEPHERYLADQRRKDAIPTVEELT